MSRNSVKFQILMAVAALCASVLLCATETNSFTIDLRDACLLNGTVRVAPSSQDPSAVPMADGTEMTGWTAEAPEWDTSDVQDGWHTLSIAGETATPEMLTVNDPGVVIHEGVLQSDEVWGADKVHVVRDWVRIPEGLRLVIANGAVVKFCQGAGILNQGTLSAVSAVLTSIEDDTVGGDTNLDGSDSAPAENSYDIRNEGTLNAINNTIRNASAGSVLASTTISENAFHSCEQITEVVIPSEVVSIGENAFGDCENLKKVTFQGTGTAVSQNAFEGCDAVETLTFSNGLPQDEFSVGQSNPTVYVNENRSETWGGYTVVDTYANGILEKTLLVPAEEGQIGQVLTVTEEGYDWQDIPVDAELDAQSKNALQNKVVTAALNELKDADKTLAGDVTALKTKTTDLADADTAMQEDITTLQAQTSELEAADTTMQGDIATLKTKTNELSSMSANMKTSIDGLAATDTAIQGDITALKSADAELSDDIDALQKTVEELSGIPTEGGEAGQVLTKTENGIEWKTINVTVDEELDAESENSVQNKVVTAALNALQEADETLTEDVTALQAKTTALEGADTAMQGDIVTLKTKTTELAGADTAMQGDIATLKTKTTELADADTAMQGDIAALKTKTTALADADTTMQDDIATLKTKATELADADTTMQGDIATLKTKATDLAAADTAMQGDIATLKTKGTDLASADTAMQGDIAALKTKATDLADADTTMQGDIATLKTKATELADADATMKNSIDGLATADTTMQGDIAALKTKATDLADADTTMQGDIATLQTADTTLQDSIDSLNTAQGTMEGNIATLQETVDGIIGVPSEGGEAGQVLTKTEDGIEWQTINVTVDEELDADSENSVQNKAVTAAVNELKETDENLDSDISALSGNLDLQTKQLKDADDAQKNATSVLQQANESTQDTLESHLSAIEKLQTENVTQQNAIATLQTENQALRSDVNELKQTVEELKKLVESGAIDQKVVTLTLEAGWNLVAMPGKVVVSESEKAILDQVEIYTFDKTQQVYIHSDGLEPLASYWMRAPEKCTIHFSVQGK